MSRLDRQGYSEKRESWAERDTVDCPGRTSRTRCAHRRGYDRGVFIIQPEAEENPFLSPTVKIAITVDNDLSALTREMPGGVLLERCRQKKAPVDNIWNEYANGTATLYAAPRTRFMACHLGLMAIDASERDFPELEPFLKLLTYAAIGQPLEVQPDAGLDETVCTLALQILSLLRHAFGLSGDEQAASFEQCVLLHPLAAKIVAN